jgi:excisionase family DNA binding protein
MYAPYSLILYRGGACMTRRGPDVLKIPEVAADLRVDRKTVYQLIRSGELRALKMGRALRVTRDALEQFKAVAVRSPPDRARPLAAAPRGSRDHQPPSVRSPPPA